MDIRALESAVLALAADPAGGKGNAAGRAVDETIAALDEGRLRVCEPVDGEWVTHAWIKEAILLYFKRREAVPFGEYAFDKIPLKTNYASLGVRCVPPGAARYGSFLGRGTILMPGYVNIGAYVGEGCMVDTWATVGSCAQIGKNVHLSGGVGIGGVLEPLQATPVIIEDGAFVGSRCVIVEGVHVEREAVIGAGVVLTASTPIVDVRGSEPVHSKGLVPARAVVIPGTLQKLFPSGTYGVPCALLIGERRASTDRKTSLNAALREFDVAV
ncbi:MAG: 2,3,4,5-tetrahydropyridine-2,6-dicarboxylate N-succinyltransferase [Candidatus Eremiobacteraeota bacterium]|nr:2,3,4,5-tetrahydropyridine-2,6-dicarboxylate N-succinyltransferase [Candidatus Eremiobacteraeota bacterium]